MNSGPASPGPLTRPIAVWSRLIEAMLRAVWLVDARTLRMVAANPAAPRLSAGGVVVPLPKR